jgi:hypothetical protein
MPLTPAISISQSLSNLSEVTIEDTSTGSDVAITARRLYLITFNGAYLVESGTLTDYTAWALADTEITVDVLTKDYALNVRVDWINVSGTALYTKTVLSCFPAYAKEFLVDRVAALAGSNPAAINNANFRNALFALQNEVSNAENAVSLASDITSAQAALTRAKYLLDNKNLFY